MVIIKGVVKLLVLLVSVALLAIALTGFSPIYNFRSATPFSGNDIFNPYSTFDPTLGWSRANFHTHTRVDGILNECDYTPLQTLEFYNQLGYDIVTFSNHNRLTEHPTEPSLQVELYEHGYNIFKFHKLVFGAERVMRFDHLLPLTASQKQFQIDMLTAQSDIVTINHPLRTKSLSHDQLEKIDSYQLIELDSGKSSENSYWDAALSAGRYSFGIANDDLHHPNRTNAIAIRSNLLNTYSANYNDLLQSLRSGCFYSMRTPDYGGGDWSAKILKNRDLPFVRNIGLHNNSAPYIALSQRADSIKVFGQHHTTLAAAYHCDSICYTMAASDPYCRFTAYFSDGEVIYSNPFARYDSTVAESPFTAEHSVNTILTILFNTLLLAVSAAIVVVTYKIVIKW